MTILSQQERQSVLDARNGVGYCPLPDYGLVRLSGPDAIAFMQNRSTNDVKALQTGEGCANTLLDRKANVQATFTTLRLEDDLLLLTEQAQLPHLIAEIQKYHIMESFSVIDESANWRFHLIRGPQAGNLLCQLFGNAMPTLNKPHDGALVELMGERMLILKQPFFLTGSTDDGYCLGVSAEYSPQLQAQLQALTPSHGLASLSPAAQEALRIEDGIPRLGVDLDTDTLLPETGLERIAVSYTKGCYLGQETVARVRTYGSVQRALIGLQLEAGRSIPAMNTPCLIEGKQAGSFKSGIDSPTLNCTVVMAYLGKDYRVPGKKLTLENDGQPLQATVTLLPFYQRLSDTEEARRLYDQALALFADGQDEEAMQLLRQALTLDATLGDAYESLGVILGRHDRFEEAIAVMQKLAELEPDRVMAYTNLSIFYMKIGDKERAEEEKARATTVAMRNRMKEAGFTADPEAERKKREEGLRQRIQLFRDALKYNPEDPLGNFGLASALMELAEFEEAAAAFRLSLKHQPNQSVAWLSLGKCLEAIQQHEEARAVYEQGIAVAAKKGDMMPLQEMQRRLGSLSAKPV